MGRGRAKAKQTKVARQLKYSSQGTDFEALQRELAGSGHPDGGPDGHLDGATRATDDAVDDTSDADASDADTSEADDSPYGSPSEV